jgi:hypothetical protein
LLITWPYRPRLRNAGTDVGDQHLLEHVGLFTGRPTQHSGDRAEPATDGTAVGFELLGRSATLGRDRLDDLTREPPEAPDAISSERENASYSKGSKFR